MNKVVVKSKGFMISALAVLALLVGVGALVGCAQNAEEKNEPAENEMTAQVEIGENSGDVYKLQIINDANVPVRQFRYKDNNTGESNDLTIKGNDNIWKLGDIANVYIPKSNGGSEQNSDVLLKDTYDFELVIDDSIQVTMHAISPDNLQSVNDLRLRYSETDNMCYFEYMDETGPVNTLESEKAVLEQERAAAEKQLREAEEQAQAQAAEEASEAYSSNNDVYVAPSAGSSSASDSVAPSAGSGAAQSEDQCAPDAVLNY